MSQLDHHNLDGHTTSPFSTPITRLTLAYTLGLTLGHLIPSCTTYLILTITLTLLTICQFVFHATSIRLSILISLTLITIAATNISLTEHRRHHHDIAQYIADQPQLTQITGYITTEPYNTTPPGSHFEKFTYHQPATCFTLKLQSITIDNTPQPATGKLLIRLNQPDHRPTPGQYIRATGWLNPLTKPSNPNQFNYHDYAQSLGIRATFNIPNRQNYQTLAQPSLLAKLAYTRQHLINAAASALHQHLPPDTPQLALLDTILLGLRNPQLKPLYNTFRTVGLAHLLAISGAHLAILLSIAYLLIRLFSPHPRTICITLLVILAIYLLLVPWRTPVIRAAIMAASILIAQINTRQLKSLDSLAIAALIILAFNPTDLFNPGFQLSFIIVTALLLFTRPVTNLLLPTADEFAPQTNRLRVLLKPFASYLAACIVAFCFAQPLLAYHFNILNPLTVFITFLAFPFITALLALGYLKIIASILLPTLGHLIATPLDTLSIKSLELVDTAAELPFTAVTLSRSPSLLWTLTTLLVTAALFRGYYRRRPIPLIATLVIILAWLFLPDPLHQPAPLKNLIAKFNPPPAVILDTLAVGNGSCHLIRLHNPEQPANPTTILFDAGSTSVNVGSNIIIPALNHLAVSDIDYLILSHPDLDHYCATLDIVDHFPVKQILLTQHFLDSAATNNQSAAHILIKQLNERNIPVTAVSAGWSIPANTNPSTPTTRILYPINSYTPKQDNDNAIVMAITTPETLTNPYRRILLTSDIQQHAISALFSSDAPLAADITTLSHHGAYNPAAPKLLAAINPAYTIQSASPKSIDKTSWLNNLYLPDTTHLSTANCGHIQFTITQSGQIRYTTFINP